MTDSAGDGTSVASSLGQPIRLIAAFGIAGLFPLAALGSYASLGGELSTVFTSTLVKYALVVVTAGALAGRIDPGASPWKLGMLSGAGPAIWSAHEGSPKVIPLDLLFFLILAGLAAAGARWSRVALGHRDDGGDESRPPEGPQVGLERVAPALGLAVVVALSGASAEWFTRTVNPLGDPIPVTPTDPIPVPTPPGAGPRGVGPVP